jgi:prepilin-type N-terminal cleavage/methylation domain-containing protein
MRRAKSGYSLIEIMVAIVIIALLSALFVGQMSDVMPAAKKMAARDAARAVQTALGAWMVSETSTVRAHARWNADANADAPANHLAFFNTYLAPYMDPATAAQFTGTDGSSLPLSTATYLRNGPIADLGGTLTLYWDHTDFRNAQPMVNLTIPD